MGLATHFPSSPSPVTAEQAAAEAGHGLSPTQGRACALGFSDCPARADAKERSLDQPRAVRALSSASLQAQRLLKAGSGARGTSRSPVRAELRCRNFVFFCFRVRGIDAKRDCPPFSFSLRKKKKTAEKNKTTKPCRPGPTSLWAAYMSFLYPTTKRPRWSQRGAGNGAAKPAAPPLRLAVTQGPAAPGGQTARAPRYTTPAYLPVPLSVCRHCAV